MSKTTIPTGGITADAIDSTLIADDAVSEEHLDATAITGSTELAASPADTDEILISDAGVLKRLDVSYIKTTLYPDNLKYFSLGSNQTCNADQTTKLTGWGNISLSGDRLFDYGTTYVSHSSGIFSFSTEGYYHVVFRFTGSTSGSSSSTAYMNITTDNSSYQDAVDVNFGETGSGGINFYMDGIFKITDTTNHKMDFSIYAATNNITAAGNTTRMRTYCRFQRIGTAA